MLEFTTDAEAEEYRRNMGTNIHPSFYSFAGHTPTYVLETARDECGASYLTKASVRNSLTLKLKSHAKSDIHCLVCTDRGEVNECISLPTAKIRFDSIDFSSLSFLTDDTASIPVHEGGRGWIYKQISVIGNSFSCPIGVYSISYRYKIKGNIKRS